MISLRPTAYWVSRLRSAGADKEHAIQVLRKKKNATANEIVQVYDRLLSLIPTSTSTNSPYSAKQKAFDLLFFALRTRQSGLDFTIRHTPELSHTETRKLSVVHERVDTHIIPWGSDSTYTVVDTYVVFEDGSEELIRHQIESSVEEFGIGERIGEVLVVDREEELSLIPLR